MHPEIPLTAQEIKLKPLNRTKKASRLVTIEEPCILGKALGFEAIFIRLDRDGNRWEIAVRRMDGNGYLQTGAPRDIVRDNRADVQAWLKQLKKGAD